MVSKITHDVLDAQQHCRLKAYFPLNVFLKSGQIRFGMRPLGQHS
jgi:hypothetical protein